MLRRRAYSRLLEWKHTKTKQALLVTGARQVGKTTLIRQFGKDQYADVAEVNFLEDERAVQTVSAARDTSDLMLRLSTIALTDIIPGHTLLFLDEIQACEDMLTWVKFLRETADVDIILSGSLLGIDLFNVRSVPVGFLQTTRMQPLDFLEFCDACSVPQATIDVVRTCKDELHEVPDYIHDLLMDLFYRYLLVGGMPDATQAYVNTRGIMTTRNTQEAILQTYEMDITKYVVDPVERRHIKSVYSDIPNQLNKENKRFKFARLGKNYRFAHLATAFDWLENAGIALAAMRVGDPQYPLGLHADISSFKLYLNDVGLLTSTLMPGAAIEILNGRSSMNFGSLFENAVAQELFATGHELFYYHTKGMGEVDFLIQDKMGNVSMVEVKSGKDYKRHRAMNNLLETRNYRFAHAYVLYDGNVNTEREVTYLPVYMASML